MMRELIRLLAEQNRLVQLLLKSTTPEPEPPAEIVPTAPKPRGHNQRGIDMNDLLRHCDARRPKPPRRPSWDR
jgi:hypothetical protein